MNPIRYRNLLWCAALFALLAACLLSPQVCASAFRQALSLCYHQLLPALFPFFVITDLLMQLPDCGLLALPLTPLCHIVGIRNRQAPALLLLGLLGGYAAFSSILGKAVSSGSIPTRDATILLLLGTSASPGFIFGCVGAMLLKNETLGLLIYCSLLIGNLGCALVFRLFVGSIIEPEAITVSDSIGGSPLSLPDALRRAVSSSLAVCGCIVFFRTLYELFLPLCGSRSGLLAVLLESTTACAQYAALGGKAAVFGCCAALSLLGLSVLLQMKALLNGTLSFTPLLLSRPLHLFLSLSSLSLLLRVVPSSMSVYSSLSPRLLISCRTSPDIALLLFALCCLLFDRLNAFSTQ